jgi:hypothetical protein
MYRNMTSTSPRTHKTTFDNNKDYERHAENIRFAYLNNTMGDETFSQKKRNFKKKCEVLGINEKLATKIFKNQHQTAKRKRLKAIVSKNAKKVVSCQRHSSVASGRRSVNLILKKQAHIIGRKKP